MTSPPAQIPEATHVDVRAGSARYRVEIQPGVARRLSSILDSVSAPARRFVVSSTTVWRLHGSAVSRAVKEDPILIPDGERFKNLQTLSRIYDGLVRANADRATTLIAVGGGVVGDIAGFAAATYLRGVPVVHVPTTLLAQVDSAIGGKVGVNHSLGKNLIGAFHQPLAVIADPLFLETLPRREFRAGLYEVVKYGAIASRSLFDRVSAELPAVFARDAATLMPIITECCQIKGRIVEQDERESGPRRALNFGHTAGHALEAITKYRRFRHGEAVAYGMLIATDLAVRRGAMPPADRDALASLVTRMGPLPPIGDLSSAQAIEAMAHDKKVVGGRLHFVLPTSIGTTEVVTDVTEKELKAAFAAAGLR
ncbi:MAG: 3-dehydroquinate synthase [Vicinamibacterales bacterium]